MAWSLCVKKRVAAVVVCIFSYGKDISMYRVHAHLLAPPLSLHSSCW